MTPIYRYATLNERDRWTPGPPPEGGFRLYDERSEVMDYVVPVVITEHVVRCFDCRGQGFVTDSTRATVWDCEGCKGTGRWTVPVVVDKDST